MAVVTAFIVVGMSSINGPGQGKKVSECQYWQSKVDETVMAPESTSEPDTANAAVVLNGIECLLKMEGNRNPARFSGAVNNEVSQIFQPAPAEVAALYYISCLYYQKWDHANAVALRGPDGKVNDPEDVREAYRSYRKWFEQVKHVGLAKARELKLEPLKDTKVSWY